MPNQNIADYLMSRTTGAHSNVIAVIAEHGENSSSEESEVLIVTMSLHLN